MKKIIAVHLLNDFSGSPLILSTVIKGFRAHNIEVDLITNENSEGFLSDLDVNYETIPYRFQKNKYARLVAFLWFQVLLFFRLFKYRKEDIVIYINTLLPFGAAIFGKLMGKEVIYHCHETSLKPLLLKQFLKYIASISATKAIYVSKFLYKKEGLKNVEASIVHNALSTTFVESAKKYKKAKSKDGTFIVLMLCSLKKYKGVMEFVHIANKLRHLKFELVINASMEDATDFFKDVNLSDNLTFFPVQKNVHLFYKRADLILNLSNPDEWIETFGMTILEAMHYGIPSIVPPVGGPVELIENGINGYHMDSRDWVSISDKIKALFENTKLYQQLCQASEQKALNFSHTRMIENIVSLIK